MEKIIEVKNLTKSYKELKALDNLTVEVYKGEILGLLGPNGSGKSTFINCLLSLLNYESGTVKIFNSEMKPSAYEIKKEIGVVFQDVACFNELTVYENIDYFCGLYIKDKKLRKQYVNEAIELVKLNDFVKFYPKKLSGGLLRRLNIACGIAHKPSIIILDEPTVATDPQSRNNILEGIKKLNENGSTIIYTTHYMEEVEAICNRIIILEKGQILARGTCSELRDLLNINEKIIINSQYINQSQLDAISKLKNVCNINYQNNELTISYLKSNDINITTLIEFLKNNNIEYTQLRSEVPSLNDVFLELTGKELKDAI